MFDFKLTKENIIKWSISLALLLFILFLFPFATLVHDESVVFTLNGYNVIFGVAFDKVIDSTYSSLEPSVLTIIGFIGLEVFALLSFINVKKVDLIKRFLTIFFGSILFIGLVGYKERYNALTCNDVLFNLTAFGKIVLIFIGALVLLAIFIYFKNREGDQIDQESIDIVTTALLFLINISFLEPFGFVKNTSYEIQMTGRIACFGEELSTKAFSLSTISPNVFATIGYAMVLVLIIISIFNVFKNIKALRVISLFVSAFVCVFFTNIDLITLNITQVSYSSTVYKSLTELGTLAGLICVIAFIANAIYVYTHSTKEETIKYAMYLIMFIGLTSVYIPAYRLYKHYTTSDNYITNISMLEILKGNVELNTNYTYSTTYPAKLFLGLGLGLGGVIIALLPVKQYEKIKYLASSGLLIASSVVIYLAKDGLLKQLVKEVSTYDVVDYINGGFIVIIGLLVAGALALYMGATAKQIKLKKAK